MFLILTLPNQFLQKDVYFSLSKLDFYINENFMRILAFINANMIDNKLKILLNNSSFEFSNLFEKFYNNVFFKNKLKHENL